MIDNLRRTLTAPLALATLVAAWTIPSASAGWWTALVVASFVVPPALPVIAGLIPRRRGISKRSHLRDVGGDVIVAAAQVMLEITFLAHQAWLMVDAIVRTLVRLLVTRKHLLEWQTAAQVKADRDLDLRGFYRQMAGSVGLAAIVGLLSVAAQARCGLDRRSRSSCCGSPRRGSRVRSAFPAAISEPVELVRSGRPNAASASPDAHGCSSRRSSRTNEHGLPPDNFQDDPQPLIAHRTSPTNIGMYLLATVSARDFGWIGTVDMVERLETTLATVARLERFHGHLYNWYDTRTLQRLEPEYVSTVDSGNLAGHLLAVSNACRQMIDQPLALGRRAGRHRRRAGARPRGSRQRPTAVASMPDTLEQTRRRTFADWSASLARLSPARARRSPVVRRVSDWPRAGSDDELATWAAAADVDGRQPSPRPLAAGVGRRRRRRSSPLAELADRPGTQTSRASRRWRRSCGGCRLSPTTPSGWSRRWTSASCSTRSASCSRSDSASGKARSIRATTTCSPRRRG